MTEPTTVIAIGDLVLKVGKEARDIWNRSELQRFFRELADAIREDPKVPTDVKKQLARIMSFMGANPDFLKGAERLLSGDASAADDMRERVRDAVRDVRAEDVEALTEAVVEDLHRAASRSKRSDRDAAYVEHERTRHEIRELGERSAVLRLINLDEAGEWPRSALRDLAERRPAEFRNSSA